MGLRRKKKGLKVTLKYEPGKEELTIKVDPKDTSPSKLIRLLLAGVTLMNNVLVNETEQEKDEPGNKKKMRYIS